MRASLLAQVDDPSFKIPSNISAMEHIDSLVVTGPAYEEAAKSIRSVLGAALANEYEAEWVWILDDLCTATELAIGDEAIELVPWIEAV